MIGLNRRRVMGGKSLPLPYDAEIEYLESTGTQWIDTGVIADSSTEIEIKFAGVFNNNRLVSTRTANWTNQLDVILYDNRNYGSILRFGTGLGAQKYYNPTINWQWYNVIMGWDRTTVNGVSVYGSYSTKQIDNPYSIILYAGGGDIKGQHACTAKVSYLMIYKGGNLISHFIPVRVGTTGYMYDKVSKQLFGNSGTGAFILGADK